jgi:FkbM family methyltransferase
MELDVHAPFQRRLFYFPTAYWRRLMSLPFGRFVRGALSEGSVLLDVGSNVGFYTLFAARQVGPSGRVVAFEPDPQTFESLKRSIARNGFTWADCRNLALSDRDGELPFFYCGDGSAHSLVAETPERAGRYAGQEMVRVTTLDGLLGSGELALPRVDLVKMDVEGEEPRTIRGMLGALEQAGFPPVWAEVRGPRGSTRAPDTFRAVRDALAPLGYRGRLWSEAGGEEATEARVVGQEDVLFERR